jgi:hypothetical protein
MPTAEKTLRNCPPQVSHVLSAGSENFCTASTRRLQLWHSYSYVGIKRLPCGASTSLVYWSLPGPGPGPH